MLWTKRRERARERQRKKNITKFSLVKRSAPLSSTASMKKNRDREIEYSYIESISENGILCKYLWYDSISTRWKQQQQIEEKKAWEKKREKKAFVLGTQVKYYDKAWCLNFMVINYLTQHHHRRHHHQCTKPNEKKRKTRNKTNIYRRKQNENPYGIYSIDYIPFSTFFRHYSPYIFLSKIDYIGNKRGDYYSINQNDCFIWKLFQFILLMDV